MYSMVLMMAMSSSPEAVACGKSYSCYGCRGYSYSCCGCKGYYSYGCSGYSYGCSGYSYGCSGYSYGCTGYYGGCYGTPVTPMPAPAPTPPKTTWMPAPATITVNVPADAKVTIDGNATTSTSAVRVYATPELQAGVVNYYTFTATIVRDGKTLTATEKVAVEAGANARLSLTPVLMTTVASK